MLRAALGLVGASAPSAQADLCFAYDNSPNSIAVGKGFTLPDVNSCKPFNASEKASLSGALTGTGCTDRNGATFICHYSYHNSDPLLKSTGSYFETGFCRFRLGGTEVPASGIGVRCRGTLVSELDNHDTFVENAKIFSCNEDVPENIGPVQ
jgi:hypothetical protein